MSASGRTKVASDVKFGVEASFIELDLWSKFGDPSSYSVQMRTSSRGRRRRRRLRQLRWARALKTNGVLVVRNYVNETTLKLPL